MQLDVLKRIFEELKVILNEAEGSEQTFNIWLENPAPNDGGVLSKGDGIYISLLNIEEELSMREGFVTNRVQGNHVVRLEPAVYLNLQIIFIVNAQTDYLTQLNILYRVVAFFQRKPVFSLKNTPELANYGFSGEDKLVFELNTLPLKDMHYIWNNLGLKQMPAVVYKVKTLKIQNSQQQEAAGVITQIELNNGVE
jgi:hypothetical protein